MPKSPLIPSAAAGAAARQAFPERVLLWPESFAKSGMPGILIRTRALLVVLFINPNGGEGPDCALKKGGGGERKKNTHTHKKKQPGKKEKSRAPEGKHTSCSHPHSVLADGKSPALASSKWHFIHWKCERCHQCPGLSSLSAGLRDGRCTPSCPHRCDG